MTQKGFLVDLKTKLMFIEFDEIKCNIVKSSRFILQDKRFQTSEKLKCWACNRKYKLVCSVGNPTVVVLVCVRIYWAYVNELHLVKPNCVSLPLQYIQLMSCDIVFDL